MRHTITALLGVFVLGGAACSTDAREMNMDPGTTGLGTTGDGGSTGGSTGEPDDSGGNEKFDVGDSGGMLPCEEGGDCPECTIPPHAPCEVEGDVAAAMGLGCDGEPDVELTLGGSPDAMGTRVGFGPTDTWAPREGGMFAVLGSGLAADLDLAYDENDEDSWSACSRDLDDPDYSLGVFDPGPLDPGTTLPLPVVPTDAGPVTCADDPNLIGMGDCSNTLQGQFDQGTSAHDWTEIRFNATVPEGVTSFSYDLAFFSYEYPDFFQSQYNDLYVGWLESEAWTGNVSFDEAGNPISLNAGFLDFKDPEYGVAMDPECMNDGDCDAPELAGTCMEGHAGTKWLTTTASVVPGEDITVVFAVFDLSDSILDSYVFLDNWQWGCEGGVPPTTNPVG